MKGLIIACALLVSVVTTTEALAKKHKPKAKPKHSAPEKKKEPEKKAESAKPTKKEIKEAKAAAAAAPTPEVNRETIKRESKIEFDERVVQGQRAQGAVYLFQRAETQFSSLVQTPDSFRYRTTQQVFGEQ